MRRKLWVVDLALLGLVVLSGSALRGRWLESVAREEALLKSTVPVAPPPYLPAYPSAKPATAVQYMEVAQQMLFVKDRNPNVILDPPPPPPPPKPVPPLPVAFGVMNLGEGPMIIAAPAAGAPHRSYKVGERIGEFKVHALNSFEVVLEWEGKYLKKRVEELGNRQLIAQAPAADQNQPADAPTTTSVQNTAIGKAMGPSEIDMGNAQKACTPGDSSPAGTVQDGYRKVITKSPFGDICRWQPEK